MSRAAKRVRSREKVVGDTDAMTQALTFAAGPVMFGLLGRVVDGQLGSGPWLFLAGLVLGIIGGASTLYYRYQARMAELDAQKTWKPKAATQPLGARTQASGGRTA